MLSDSVSVHLPNYLGLDLYGHGPCRQTAFTAQQALNTTVCLAELEIPIFVFFRYHQTMGPLRLLCIDCIWAPLQNLTTYRPKERAPAGKNNIEANVHKLQSLVCLFVFVFEMLHKSTENNSNLQVCMTRPGQQQSLATCALHVCRDVVVHVVRRVVRRGVLLLEPMDAP
jgi:hypothetical protein